MSELALVSVAFNRPLLISHQIRLLRKYLKDDYTLTVVDNSSEPKLIHQIMAICAGTGTPYVRAPTSKGQEHYDALNYAWREILEPSGAPYVGTLDHDVFPATETTVIDKINKAGFYGVGQRHSPTNHLYLWPGLWFASRQWIAGREVNFDGIRGEHKRDDGDTGSANWPLFADVDWSDMFQGHFGYEAIRPPDDYGLQSWAVERLGDFLHLSNGSGWMAIPHPEQRERLCLEMLEQL
ncbi:MAG: hypothetical protein EPN91_02030 [Salinibacterium sp.]|nr:MAG: hypothetical protein EPN91_02030 [Salinibacterium sp.]